MQNTMSVGGFISFGWETFKRRPWFLIGATIVWIILNWCVGFVSGFVAGFAGASLGSGFESFANFIVSFPLSSLLAMGWVAFFIKAHDDIASVKLSAFWHPKKFWSYLGANILFSIILAVGFILFIIPGFIALTVFIFAPYFVIDKGMGPIEALKASARITKGNRLRVLALLGAVTLVSLLGLLAFIVGLFVAIPLTLLAYAHTYRSLSAAADANEARQPLSGGETALLFVGGILPVIAIVGILASIVLASLNVAREKARGAAAGANLKYLQLDLELYSVDHKNFYPAKLSDMSGDPQVLPKTMNLSFDDFSYTQLAGGKAYRLCSNQPVLNGESCVTSDSGTTTTP